MSSKLNTVCYELSHLFIAASFATYSKNINGLTPKHITSLAIFVFGYLLHYGLEVYSSAIYSFSNTFVQYAFFIIVIYVLGILVTYFRLIRHRAELFAFTCRSEIVLQGLASTHNQHQRRRILFSVLKLTLIVFNVGYALLNIVFYVTLKHLQSGMSLKTVFHFITTISCQPLINSNVLVWYNFSFGKLIELEAFDCVFSLVIQNHKVAWDETERKGTTCMFDISNLIFDKSWILRKFLWKPSKQVLIVNASHLKKLWNVVYEVKKFHVETVKLFLKEYSFITILSVFSFPFSLVLSKSGHIEIGSIMVQVFSTWFILSTVLLDTCISYRTNYFGSKIKREIFDYEDLKARAFLKRSIFLAKEPYTQSHNSLFDVDFDLVSNIVDFVVLISTSLYVAAP